MNVYILRYAIYVVVTLKMSNVKKVDERTLFIRAVLVRNKVSAVDSLRLRFCGFDCFDELVLYHKATLQRRSKSEEEIYIKSVQIPNMDKWHFGNNEVKAR